MLAAESNAYAWFLWLHLVGVLGFVGAHGVSAAVGFRLRRERDPARIRALLDLSKAARPWGYVALLLLGIGGLTLAFAPGVVEVSFVDDGWIWASIAVLLVLLIGAVPLAVPYYRRVRLAVAEGSTVAPEELDRLLGSARPLLIALVEGGGLLILVWLMVAKPG
jgi:uncharacterized membrane protein